MSAKTGIPKKTNSLNEVLHAGPEDGSQGDVSSRMLAVLPTVGALLILQALLISITFPISEMTTTTPLFHNDGAFHWYEMKVAVNLARQGKLIGYDPFFNAGYIGGVGSNQSAKFAAAMAVVLQR